MANDYPNAVELEKRLLSAMMLREGQIIPQVMETLGDGADLYRESNRMIYRAMTSLYTEGTPPDVLLVEGELKRRGELDKVGRAYLFSLVEQEYTTSKVANYVEQIRDKAIRRRLIAIGEGMANAARVDKMSAMAIFERAAKKLQEQPNATPHKSFESIKIIGKQAILRTADLIKHPKELSGVTTGYLDLNKVTNGWQKSDLILLAARPSMGKTALALNMAVGAARSGATVGIFSLEMSKLQLGTRLISLESQINAQKLNTGDLSKEELGDMVSAYERLSKLAIYIDDTAGLSLSAIKIRARELKREVGLGLLVLDYIQLMQGQRTENRQQEVSEISRGLKAFARELDIPILALSQLSRQVEMRAEKKPQLSDLRESGSLEQDADLVMFLYRDEYYNRDEAESQNLAEVIIAKNRNGPTTSVTLQFTKETMTFKNYTKQA